MIPQYRIEQYLNAINAAYLGDSPLPEYPSEPVWRIEGFLAAILSAAKGDSPVMVCPDPVWRIEEFARAIYDALTGASPAWPCPVATNRIEEILCAIYKVVADGEETEKLLPAWDIEQWLLDSYDAAKEGGDITKTVSGTMVHITDALAKAALSVLASIEPIQDLHGYDHPWPAGGGKNKFPVTLSSQVKDGTTFTVAEDGSIMISGTPSRLTRVGLNQLSVTPENDMKFSMTGSATGIRVFCSETINGSTSYPTLTPSITMDAGATYTSFLLEVATTFSGTVTVKFQVEDGTTVTAWTPYSNICPISGRTGLSVYRTGKNLIDGSKTNQQGANQLVLGQESSYSTRSIFLKAGQYIVSVVLSKTASIYLATDTNTGGSSIGNTTSARTFTLAEDSNISMWLYTSNGVTASDLTSVQLELGSTASTYEPYNGNTYAVDWTTEAGTVYHGTVDPVSGQLTVDWASVDMGSLTWSYHSGSAFFFTGSIGEKPPALNTDRANMLCEIYDVRALWADEFGTSDSVIAVTNQGQIRVRDLRYTDAALYKSAVSGVKLVYELATPLTYQLTPQEVQMLLGENYVWSSSGDTVSVTYYGEGNANTLQSLNILLGGNYSNPKTADDVSDKEALEIILGGNK